VGPADEEVSEGRYGTGKSKLQANEISLQVGMGALERPRRIAEIRSDGEGAQEFKCAAHFPTVEIEIACGGGGDATGDDTGALGSLRVGHRRAHEGVTAKKLNALSMEGAAANRNAATENRHSNLRIRKGHFPLLRVSAGLHLGCSEVRTRL